MVENDDGKLKVTKGCKDKEECYETEKKNDDEWVFLIMLLPF